jgi:hypothetical protein
MVRPILAALVRCGCCPASREFPAATLAQRQAAARQLKRTRRGGSGRKGPRAGANGAMEPDGALTCPMREPHSVTRGTLKGRIWHVGSPSTLSTMTRDGPSITSKLAMCQDGNYAPRRRGPAPRAIGVR